MIEHSPAQPFRGSAARQGVNTGAPSRRRRWPVPRAFLVALLIAPLLGSPCAVPYLAMFRVKLPATFLGQLSADESNATLKSTTAWETNGPYGGPVRYGLAIDPNTPATVYAASSGGVFKTADGGSTWTPSSKGINEMFEIKSVAVDPTNPTTVYAGNSDSEFALFRSTDSGATWTSQSTNLSGGTVNAIAIDPSNSSTIYAGSPVGLWKSTDGSATWGYLSGLGQRDVVRLAIDRSAPSTVYALTTNAGVYKSTNSGTSWTAANTGLLMEGNSIGLGAASAGLSVDPTTSSRVYVGNYVSTNSGASWTAISALDGTITGHAFNGSTVFASSQVNGVYKSADSGQTWAKVGSGLPVGSVWSVAVDPKNAQTVYATTDSGIYKSTNGGAAWVAVNKGVSNTDVSAVIVDSFAPANVFAGTYSNGIFRSSDSGATWSSVYAGTLATTRIMGMATDPQTPATVYAANWFGAVLKSTNRGATWTSAATADRRGVLSIAVDPVDPSTLYVGTAADGMLKSTDRGATFTVVSSGLPRRDDNALAFATIAGVAVSPKDRSVWAWVQTGDASFKASISRDGGTTWSSSYPGWNPLLPMSGAVLLDFLTNTVGLKNISANFVTKQYGGPPFCLPITQVIADPFDSTLGYASGGCGVGRAKFANADLTAAPVPARLPTYLYANALALTPTGTDLYVGMQWGGVYKYTLDTAPRAVEYYLASRDHYFITADPIEQAAVDAGAAGPFFRTGGVFKAGGSTPVCRFFGNTNINPATGAFYGPTSHFYTADANECAGLKAQYVANAKAWSFESNDFLTTPAVAGTCAAGLQPIYRAYNNAFVRGEDSNHRITADQVAYQAQVAKGWLAEGIVMCAPR